MGKKVYKSLLAFVLASGLLAGDLSVTGALPVAAEMTHGTKQIILASSSEAPAIVTDSNGTETVQIKTADDLMWFSAQVSAGNTSLNAMLLDDIDLTGEGINWSPIGSVDSSAKVYYTGIFNGNGKTVTVSYDYNDLQYSAAKNTSGVLFSALGTGGIIQDVTVAGNAAVYGYSGGIVGVAAGGQIVNCMNAASISTNNCYTAGIAGLVENVGTTQIMNCINKGDVIGTNESKGYAGGIVAMVRGGGSVTLTGCRNYGSISSYESVGGIIGNNLLAATVIQNCANYGDVQSHASGMSGYAGGIAGVSYNGGMYESDCNYGTVTGDGNPGSGIVGYMSMSATGQITDCFNIGSVNVMKTYSAIVSGGIAGSIGTTAFVVRNCYSAGQIQLSGGLGGLAGAIIADASGSTLANVTNNFALSGSAPFLIQNATFSDSNAAFKSADEMKSLGSVLGNAYVEDTENVNNGYPMLGWETGDVPAVINLINSIGTVTEDNNTDILEARDAYDRLSTAYKPLVTNYGILESAERSYHAFGEAKNMDAMIDAIGTVTADSKSAIAEARKAYDALTEEAKALVTKLDVLTAAEGRYEQLMAVCEVAFDANGGTKLSQASEMVNCGSAIGTLPTCQRLGYAFVGWYTAENDGNKVSAATVCNDNVTYYAHWMKVDVAKTQITGLKSGVKKFTVIYKAVSKGAGYQIRYSVHSNMSFSKSLNTVNAKETVAKLKSGTRYYIQVRAFKTDSTGGRVYALWSVKKSVKTK